MSAYNEKRATARSSAAPETGEGQVSQSNDYFITTILAMQHAKEERTGIKRVSVADRVLKELRKYAGSDIGVSRQMLASATGYSDRAIRRAIAALRADFEPIGQGPNGGYTYGTIDGIRRAIADYHAKAVRNYKMQFALEQAYAGLLNEHFPVLDDLAALEEVGV